MHAAYIRDVSGPVQPKKHPGGDSRSGSFALEVRLPGSWRSSDAPTTALIILGIPAARLSRGLMLLLVLRHFLIRSRRHRPSEIDLIAGPVAHRSASSACPHHHLHVLHLLQLHLHLHLRLGLRLSSQLHLELQLHRVEAHPAHRHGIEPHRLLMHLHVLWDVATVVCACLVLMRLVWLLLMLSLWWAGLTRRQVSMLHRSRDGGA